MTRDESKELVKQEFARDPRRLVDALGIRVDEARSKGAAVWCFDGNEDQASLQIGGKMEGLCTRYGDDWHGDCFALVQRCRPNASFRERLEFVAGVYGVALDEPRRSGTGKPAAAKTGETLYRVLDGDEVVAVHKREDYADGSKRMGWYHPDGVTSGLPEGLKLANLPLWQSWQITPDDKRAVVVCEGEKDADAVRGIGVQAVGTYGADCIPTVASITWARGRQVFLWPDNDPAGRRHMDRVAQAIADAGGVPFIMPWADAPEKGGAADFVAAGGTRETFREVASGAHRWRQPECDVAPEVAASIEDAVNDIPCTPPDQVFRGAVPMADVAEEVILSLETRRLLPRQIYGMRSGFPGIDWYFLGFRWQGLMLLMGDSGCGKTTIARHFAFATAEALLADRSDSRLLVYILEGGKEQFLRYYAGYKWGFPANLWRPGSEDRMTPDWADVLVRAYSEFPRLPIDVCDSTRDADQILFDIERRATAGNVEGVIIDNVQLLTYSGGGNEWTSNKRAAMRALDMCDRLGFPLLALSQINYDGKAWKARGGPEWYNNAPCVWFAERGEAGDPKEQRGQSNLLRLHNLKARYEESCMPEVRLLGNRSTGRLYEEADYATAQAQGASYTPAAEYERRGM